MKKNIKEYFLESARRCKSIREEELLSMGHLCSEWVLVDIRGTRYGESQEPIVKHYEIRRRGTYFGDLEEVPRDMISGRITVDGGLVANIIRPVNHDWFWETAKKIQEAWK